MEEGAIAANVLFISVRIHCACFDKLRGKCFPPSARRVGKYSLDAKMSSKLITFITSGTVRPDNSICMCVCGWVGGVEGDRGATVGR